ncbi:hypothetical protein FB45DRAFT_1034100 [Roridomyces roridus]|uniref:F-box domain-containing protein n=1 Tax=Roridomyces roridus TaxID=1738132 RepID=A0AAD7BD78_9AGAR|nr:hypothetical protein FB45DRAFT_1034100 [Roridomyces roridus]
MSTRTLPGLASACSSNIVRARLAEIDSETKALQARLAVLARERRPIADALRGIVYPGVVDLPPEITAEIFLHYVVYGEIGGTDPKTIGWTPLSSCSPLVLASTCRTWREIALSLPSIWSNVNIVAQGNAVGSAEKLLERWFPRASSHPLTVSFHRGDNSLLKSLIPVLPRLQSFMCWVPVQTPFPDDLFRGCLPSLRSLSISSDSQDGADATNALVAFADAPQLREVCLSQFPLLSIQLPWEQLTQLALDTVYIDECLVVLRQTIALETLSVAQISEPDEFPVMADIRLAYLHTLTVFSPQYPRHLLSHLILPVLTHIEFPLPAPDIFAPEARSARTCFTSLVERSACALRSIKFVEPSVTATIACLRTAGPTVSTIHLEDVDWTVHGLTDLLHALRDDSESGFVPQLTSLSLTPFRSAVEVPYAELAEVLALRAGKLDTFELVLGPTRFSFEDPPPSVNDLDDALYRLRELEARGMKLNIRSVQKLSEKVDCIAVAHPRWK